MSDVSNGPAEGEQKPDESRVVVTGLGLVNALSEDVEIFWERLLAGTSGISELEADHARDYPTWICSQVPDFKAPGFVDKRELRRMARFSQFALAAGKRALLDAGFEHRINDERAGVCVGTAVGGLPSTQKAVDIMRKRSGMRVSPFYIVTAPCNMAAYHLAQEFQILGYNNTFVTACAAGTQAIGEAANVIFRGDADMVLAGGSEASICELSTAAFSVGKAFSRRNELVGAASRPFDSGRDGFIGGEGAGMLVLERLDRARARGASIYAEVLGYGASNDAYHRIAPDPSGAGQIRAIKSALSNAGLQPDDIDHINAHATSTPGGDATETESIKSVFGQRAYDIPITANKSMFGHLFGAAGAVEGIATILALRDGWIPPTINLDDPDPICDLDYVPHRARQVAIETAISNSFGLGGQNAVAVFKRYCGADARPARGDLNPA